jgi:hypothetical protein
VQAGAELAILNLEPTHLDDRARWLIRERAATAVAACCEHLGVAAGPSI